MSHLLKPLRVALQGKGPGAFVRRAWSINRRYGLTAAKMDRAIGRLVEIAAAFEAPLTLPITAVALARHPTVAQKYQAQGVEFAVHGYAHIDHTLLSLAEQEGHLRQARQVFERAGIKAAGFRAPYLRANADTRAALAAAGFVYDSSDSVVWEVAARHQTERYRRALAFYGAQPATDRRALPWLDASGLVRIPYCLPDDEALVERLHWASSAEMAQVWPDLFSRIHQRGELFTLGLHPERAALCAEGLTAAPEAVREAGAAVWRARLGEIAAWWRARARATVRLTWHGELGHLSVEGPPGTTLLVRGLEVRTATVPWSDGYRRATELPCVVRTDRRPFIGLLPQADPALGDLLRQQGYIVETTDVPDEYTYVLERRTWSPADGRRLLAQIEGDAAPLVRLGRWPHGARSAFCITGDIDALTVWDYIQRLRGR